MSRGGYPRRPYHHDCHSFWISVFSSLHDRYGEPEIHALQRDQPCFISGDVRHDLLALNELFCVVLVLAIDPGSASAELSIFYIIRLLMSKNTNENLVFKAHE